MFVTLAASTHMTPSLPLRYSRQGPGRVPTDRKHGTQVLGPARVLEKSGQSSPAKSGNAINTFRAGHRWRDIGIGGWDLPGISMMPPSRPDRGCVGNGRNRVRRTWSTYSDAANRVW